MRHIDYARKSKEEQDNNKQEILNTNNLLKEDINDFDDGL